MCTSIQEETAGHTEGTLETLYLLAGLGTSCDSMGGAGESGSRDCLRLPADAATLPQPNPHIKPNNPYK